MMKTNRLVAMTAIAGFALALPAVTRASVTNTYAYQPLTVKIVAHFSGTAKTNGTAVTVTETPAGKINNAVLIQKFAQLTKNNFSPKAQLLVKSLVTDQSHQNTQYRTVIVDGTKEVDVHSQLYVGTDGDEIVLSGKADLATGKGNIQSMATLYVGLNCANDTEVYLYGCGKGETAAVRLNKEVIGYVQHWASPEAGYRVWEGQDAMFDGTVSIGHVLKVVTVVED